LNIERQTVLFRALWAMIFMGCIGRVPSMFFTEQRHQSVAEFLGDMAAHLSHGFRCGIQIRADEIAPFLRVEFRGDTGRIDQIAEYHRDVTALAGSFRGWRESWLRGGCWRL